MTRIILNNLSRTPNGLVVSLVLALLTFPWLNPMAEAVSPPLLQWLSSLFCGLLVWWLAATLTLAPDGGQALRRWQGQTWMGVWVAVFLVLISWKTPQWSGQFFLTVAACFLLVGAIDVGARATHNQRLLQLILVAWLLAAVCSSVIAIIQYFGWSQYFKPFINQTTLFEPFGNLRQRNQLGTHINIGIVAFIWGLNKVHTLSAEEPVFGDYWKARLNSRTFIAIAWVLLTLLLIALTMSRSRTGLVGLFLILAGALVWRKSLVPSVRKMVMATPFIYIAVTLGLPYLAYMLTGIMPTSIFSRIAEGEGQSCQSRVFLYQNMIDLIKVKPWSGWGWQELGFAHYVTQFDERFCGLLDNAHNLPLHLAVELGLPAAFLLMLPLVWFFLRRKPWGIQTADQQIAVLVIVLIGLHSMLEFPLWYGPFVMALGLALGLLCPRLPANNAADQDFRSPLGVRTVFVVLLSAVLAWAGWGYYRVLQLFDGQTTQWNATLRSGNWELSSQLLYKRHLAFYNLLTTPLRPESALNRFILAGELLHYSPEPRIIADQINAAYLSGLDKEVLDIMMARFKSVYPESHKEFVMGQTLK